MRLEEKISEGIKDAMKAKDKVRLEVLRNIKKYILEAKSATAGIDELPDAECVKIIQRLTKQSSDAAAIYKEQNRPDLYEHEAEQVTLLKEYLPKQMDDAQLTSAVKAIIERTGASSMKDMGKVMGIASKELAGVADGKDISTKVKNLLA